MLGGQFYDPSKRGRNRRGQCQDLAVTDEMGRGTLGGGELKSSAQPPVVSCWFTTGTSSEEGVTRVPGLLLYTGDESLESLYLRALRSCLLVEIGTTAGKSGSLCAPSIQGRNCQHMSIKICFPNPNPFSTLTILQPT